jgi:hypothetical protein
MGHEERFLRRRLSGRCGFRKQSVACREWENGGSWVYIKTKPPAAPFARRLLSPDDMTAISDRGAAPVIALALVGASPARAAERQFDQDWDWGTDPDQQDACREADRIAQDCAGRTPSGFAWCAELRLRRARRAYSAFSSRIANDRATA